MKFKDLKVGEYFQFYRTGYNEIYLKTGENEIWINGKTDDWDHDSFDSWDLIRLKPTFEEIPDPILDKAEKRYLENVIRPFKGSVISVSKLLKSGNLERIRIKVPFSDIEFPYFKAGTMYANMERYRDYTLKELGLFEDE